MAVFIPSVKPEEFNNSYGEMKVYEALRSLDDQYTVFYSLSWVGINEKRSVGEADFVIAHPQKGIFVIEVKSGEIEYKKGDWIQTNTKSGVSKVIHPYDQARKSQFELLDRLSSSISDFRLPMMCYGVWFPSVDIKPNAPLPPESPIEVTLDRTSLDNPIKAIEKAYSYWATKYRQVTLDQAQFQKVINVLCPHFHVVPKLKTKIEELEDTYIQLTKQQVSLLDFLEEQKTAVIHGLAGTGKTVIAVEKAKRLAAQGQQVLFLCYNSFLRDSLKNNNSIPNVTFHNAHSLAFEIMGSSDAPMNRVLEEFEEYLEEVFDEDSWEYSNIIVDEGQDLDDRLLSRLYELVKNKKGCIYVFYDKNQFIMKNKLPKWIEEADCKLVLHKNCRNTAEVFKTSCSIMGLDEVSYNDVHGETPSINFYTTEKELNGIVESFLKRITEEGLTASDVVILTATTEDNSWVDVNKKYAGVELTSTAEPGKILFTTIRKFKGLEAEAILIVDASMLALQNPENRRLLYTGSSRAKNLLNIAMLEDVETSAYGDYLRSIAPNRNVPKNKKGLKRLLNVTV
ncbi:nuclease-related domain-containing DEAD/DEAH box helicase [Butyrivibrio sp. XPD2006]|uniref:nuclease-related domain-containing DEAD/DEAH box helicase n=1 Tax=Butyrivibrio sp. XPD2006 TaxID=1280668 RepID=UPI0003B4B4FE|nr:nuclease-related domain-containing DEAD/DEAH box helicase [Butyrivibrio sp. XPD2006]